MTSEKTIDRVGYKHPPRKNQFQPGTSGNPAGRPRGARNIKCDLREELAELVPFNDGTHSIELTKQRLLIKRLVASAIDGDARAIATILSISLRAFGDDNLEEAEDAPEDREIMEACAAPPARRSASASGEAKKGGV